MRAEELVGDSQEQQPDHQGLKDHVDKTRDSLVFGKVERIVGETIVPDTD